MVIIGNMVVGSGWRAHSVEISEREQEVLRLVMQGASNKAIAEQLSISEHTVRAHVRSLMQKTQTENRTVLAVMALNGGYSGPSQTVEYLRRMHTENATLAHIIKAMAGENHTLFGHPDPFETCNAPKCLTARNAVVTYGVIGTLPLEQVLMQALGVPNGLSAA